MSDDWASSLGSAVGTALFVLAHPDDEFFCLPLLERERRAGSRVAVVYLTDGGPQAARRERESTRVLGRWGVDAASVTFGGREEGWPDGGLHRHLPAVREWLHDFVQRQGTIARAFVTAWEGGHHDHDSCFGVLASLQLGGPLRGIDCFQFPLYTGAGLPGPLFRCMSPLEQNGRPLELALDLPTALRAWREAAAYPSQWKTWVALGPTAAPAYLLRRALQLQRATPERARAAPHPGLPYLTRRFGVPATEVLEAVARVLPSRG